MSDTDFDVYHCEVFCKVNVCFVMFSIDLTAIKCITTEVCSFARISKQSTFCNLII